MVADDDLEPARQRATGILGLERAMHLNTESWLNHALTPLTEVAVPMSFWYASLHCVVTPAVLMYLFLGHRDSYPRARSALVIGSVIGLVAYMLIPTAPPRLMPGNHYLDALAETADYGCWTSHDSWGLICGQCVGWNGEKRHPRPAETLVGALPLLVDM